jgi:sugar phosphate isomerase/epimerase
VVGGNPAVWRVPAQERIERMTPMLRELADEAASLDLALAIENHADFAMSDLVSFAETVDRPNVGICFDSGNAVRVGDDLLEAARLAAPHIRMVHIKDLIVQAESRGDPGAWWPSAPLGRGDLSLPALVALLREAGYAGTFFIEMANMHPEFSDEDAAVVESIAYLRRTLRV